MIEIIGMVRDYIEHKYFGKYTEILVTYTNNSNFWKINETPKSLELPPQLNLGLKKGDKIKIIIDKIE